MASLRDLDRAITERTVEELKQYPVEANELKQGVQTLIDQALGPYWVWEDTSPIDSHPVGAQWINRARETLLAGVMADIRQALIPKLSARLVDLLQADPPRRPRRKRAIA